MKNEIMTVNGIECYEQNGTAYLKLETVARGLGFTQEKNGVEYIKWERVSSYLSDLGFSPEVGKDGFIPENIFYRLAMKAKNEAAERFQAKIADEVIPSIRKTGTYSVRSHTNPAIAEKRAAAMELNARSRVAAQMLKLWNEAGVAPQYQAVAMQDYYPNLALPREALAGLATAMLDATTIAKNLGVLSKNGKPHSHAIAAVIKKLGELSAEEYALTPYQNKGHDGVAPQYSVSVQHKVANWLEENGYPDTIRSDEGKKFTVRYSNHR